MGEQKDYERQLFFVYQVTVNLFGFVGGLCIDDNFEKEEGNIFILE